MRQAKRLLNSVDGWNQWRQDENDELIDLFGANLHDANLSYANLIGANLRDAESIVRLPTGDPRGYDAIAVEQENGWYIAAGCRWLTLADARKHWGKNYDGDRETGDQYLYAIDWLERKTGEAAKKETA